MGDGRRGGDRKGGVKKIYSSIKTILKSDGVLMEPSF